MPDLEPHVSAVAAAASKAASAATFGGMGGAVLSGMRADVLGVIVAGCLGLLGIVIKAVIDIHFRRKHYRLAVARNGWDEGQEP